MFNGDRMIIQMDKLNNNKEILLFIKRHANV